jgi:hypothetical protein
VTTRPKTALAVAVVGLSLLLTGCQSVASPNTLSPSPSAPLQVNPGGPEIPFEFAPKVVQPNAERAALHAYEGNFGGPVSGPALGSRRPCPGTLMSGLVLMVGKTQVAAVFICPVTKPGNSSGPYTGAFQQVPANRIDALIAALSYRPTMPEPFACTLMGVIAPFLPVVILETRNGVYYDVALRTDRCNGALPDDVAKAIDTALAPVSAHSVAGVRGYPAGPIDLGAKCNTILPVHNGPLIAAPITAVTTIYVCPPVSSSTGNTPRYYKTVPDSKTAALLSALAGPDDHPGGPFWHCGVILKDTGYAVIAQSSDGSLWRIRVPTAGCGQPTIAVGKAVDAALGTHGYDRVKGYGL